MSMRLITTCPLAKGCRFRLQAGMVWLSDITAISKASAAFAVQGYLLNYLNTKTARQDPVHCNNCHVVNVMRLIVLTARCVAQKGYNPSLFYRALFIFSLKKSQHVCDCFSGSL